MTDWFEITQDQLLQQGDLFTNCPVLVPSIANSEPPEDQSSEGSLHVVDLRYFDVVILSQTCDLQQGKLKLVLVAPYWPIEVAEQYAEPSVQEYLRSKRGREEIRRGYVPSYHMLAESRVPNFEQGITLVDFRTTLCVPFAQLARLASDEPPRLRIQTPYREHLSQAFARFFMRVGLPADIPPFR